jgi:tetratricopeptide (TPR) repeat protein
MLAQSPPPPCPAARPVDDILAEIQKQQSKKKHRNPNPFPDFVCVWGWCHDSSRPQTPPTVPGPTPESKPSGKNEENTSSSKADPCQAAMEMAIEAAHNVDVGDYYYFEAKNYNGALLRYQDADQQKPGDAAIHVRLGRALEKLRQIPQAIEQYKAALTLAGPEKWSDEAKAAVLRLERRESPKR